MTVSRRLRFEILRRDGMTCRYCGAKAPDVTLTIDHVVPVALGGGDEPSNLMTACEDCNGGKTSIAPDQALVEDVDSSSFLLASALERAAAIRRADVAETQGFLEDFDAAWRGWTTIDGNEVGRPREWRDSVERFYANGLTIDELTNFIRVAMESHAELYSKFRYFCGCCWREIGTRQEIARQLIEDGQV